MSSVPEPIATPSVRVLTRRGVPLHYVVPALTALIGIGLLWLGGAPAALGGWWLATALPISLGAFWRSPWLTLAPVALWILWVIVGIVAGPDAALANTPVPLAIFLACIGAGGTFVAQRAIFPATDPEAWEARAAESVDEAEEDADDALPTDGLVVVPFDASETVELDPDVADAIDLGDEPAADADQSEDAEDDAADAAAVASVVDLIKPTKYSEPRTVSELPLDADPAPLDQGGHVTEFTALSEADFALLDSPSGDDKTEAEGSPDEAAGPTVPAATRAGRKGRSSAG